MGAIPAQAAFNGILAGVVGFASSFAVVLNGLKASGATDAQAASGLMAVSIGCGLCAIVLSWPSRLPVSIAWSTPGAALLVSTGQVDGGFAGAVGAFIVCALGFIVAGLWKPLGRAVSAIPTHLANALLAGILVGLCLAPFQAIAFNPAFGIPVLGAWIIGGWINRLLAVPAALLAFVVVVVVGVDMPSDSGASLASALVPPIEWVTPTFSVGAILSVSIPLFLVTMASQNIAGAAVMASFGYKTRPGGWIATTGVFSFIAAFLGGHAVNLAAITAALCAGDDAHPDPSKRYWAAVFMGVMMIVLGLLSGVVITFIALAPPILIQAVAGLALVGAFTAAAVAAFSAAEHREASAITFLFAASGISLFGVSGAFWGLIAGAGMTWAKARLSR